MTRSTTKTTTALLGALAITGFLPRCSCDEGPGIQRAAVQMKLTYVEEEPCSGAQIPRRIPDDYTTGLNPSTDFGSVGTRRFEVRSVGIAPLNVVSVELVNQGTSGEPDPEFTLALTDVAGEPVTLPVSIAASADPAAPPGLIITVDYGSQDTESDLVNLVVTTDDPEREIVEFGLSAGRGRIEVMGNAVCTGMDGVERPCLDFSNVSIDSEGTETVVIKNVGEGDLDLRSVRLESESLEFCAFEATEIPDGVEDCAPVPQCLVIPPGGEYQVRVRYRPVDGGLDRGTIYVASGDANAGTIEVPINAQGAGPGICVSVVENGVATPVTFVDFGLANVNEGVARTVRLESCGTDSVDITEAVLETMGLFETGPEFSITRPFDIGLKAPLEFAEGEITYTPTSGGMHRGGLRYRIASLMTNAWVRLEGAASTCDLEVFPQNVNFGTVAGGAIGQRDVVLANNGARDCMVTDITDPDNSYSIPMRPTLPLTIAPGATQIVRVEFAPPTGPVANYTSSFDVTSDEPGPGATNTVNLNAEGGGTPVCQIRLTPSGNDIGIMPKDGRLRFGAVNIGYTKSLPIRVENVGNADCTFNNFTMTVQEPTQFSITPVRTVPAQIPAGGTFQLDVTFAPTMEASTLTGTYGGIFNYVNFTMSGPGLAQTDYGISISAQPTRPTIDVIPGMVDFGVVTWENPLPPDNRSTCGSTTRSVNIYNSGNGPLNLTDVSIDTTSDPVFLITAMRKGAQTISPPYQNIMLAAGESASVDLRFFPSRATPAAHNGLLVIDNDVTNAGGMGSPLTIPLLGEGTINSQQTDVFQQLTDNKVDILWVVDDSGSMSEEQNLLANNFAGFIGYADNLPGGVDYQVAVTTTEVNDGVSGHIWACNGYNKILTRSDPNRVAAFQCAANVTNPPGGNSRPNPTGSDEQEAGLQAARIALDVPVINNENAGFLRSDARLAVIMVSDEEDQSDGTVNLYIDFFRNIKGFANPQLVSVSAIAGDVPGGCATAVEGARYNAVAQALGGQFESICSQSWAQLLQNIGLDVFALRRAWTLSRPANPTTIVVRVNGVVVPQNGTNGWTYDSTSNTVTFHGMQIPPAGSTVEIQYGTQCLM
ncbi:MAG: choice-of-anchor D domain-containing protein [Deltaproteobacteria bacterium]